LTTRSSIAIYILSFWTTNDGRTDMEATRAVSNARPCAGVSGSERRSAKWSSSSPLPASAKASFEADLYIDAIAEDCAGNQSVDPSTGDYTVTLDDLPNYDYA